jgi:hypothetical protein
LLPLAQEAISDSVADITATKRKRFEIMIILLMKFYHTYNKVFMLDYQDIRDIKIYV